MSRIKDNQSRYIIPDIQFGRLRLLFRWFRFGVRSACQSDWDFVANALQGSLLLIQRRFRDMFSKNRSCNVCGWQGDEFYPNVGPGYFEKATTCPRCFCQDRHRSLVRLLADKTTVFNNETTVLEVAPMRSFQKYCLLRKNEQNYLSFDYERYAMEPGDITQMKYENSSYDYFICMHVLEHIEAEKKALKEVERVLKPGGTLVIQVPVDYDLEDTVEYDKPNPRETGHVRRYGSDFAMRLEQSGFEVEAVQVSDYLDDAIIQEGGYGHEPIYLARKPFEGIS
jgi:SAM-dependent methyltransferase